MQTTTLPLTPKQEPRRFGERTNGQTQPKKQRETLEQAKERLIEIQRRAAARGIQSPQIERPTLAKVRDEIEILERQLALSKTTAASPPLVTPVQDAQPAPPMASATTEKVIAKARAFLTKSPAVKPSRAETPTRTPPLDTRDMTASQLAAAIEREPDAERKCLLFRELTERERGKPTREIAEIGETATVRRTRKR
jgi:hypothetical protein